MSEPVAPDAFDAPSATPPVGEMLRQAREAAGLSIEAVAQQLKLAPKQVKALEDGEYELLPGRTFVRGFLRNYARLLLLDPDAVVAALPDASAAPALERPTLAPSPRPMGEIRFDEPRSRWMRWAIPLVLIAVVAVAALYEFTRRRAPAGAEPETAQAPAPAVVPAPFGSTPPSPSEPGVSALPNPLTAAQEPATASNAPANAPPAAAPATGSAAPAAASPPSTAPGTGPVSTVIPAPQPGEATLVVVFRDKSWVDIRDATGKPLLRMTGTAGTTQSVAGTPPYDIVVGYVPNVQLTYRGAPVDLAAHNVGNVARFRLP